MVYNSSSYSKWAKDLCISSKTVKSSLQWLIKNRWVTVNSKRGSLRIISYKKLAWKLDLKFQTGFLFEPDNYQYFKAMCCGVVLTFYLNRKRYFNRRSVNIKGFANSTNRRKYSGFYPMPNEYLAQCLGVSITTAYRYKTEAERGNFIETKSNFSHVLNADNEKITSDNYFAFILNNQTFGLPNTIRKGKKYLKEVEADLIHSNITLKKKNVKF